MPSCSCRIFIILHPTWVFCLPFHLANLMGDLANGTVPGVQEMVSNNQTVCTISCDITRGLGNSREMKGPRVCMGVHTWGGVHAHAPTCTLGSRMSFFCSLLGTGCSAGIFPLTCSLGSFQCLAVLNQKHSSAFGQVSKS